MNKFKNLENAIMAFGPILGHGWIANELTTHAEQQQKQDWTPIDEGTEPVLPKRPTPAPESAFSKGQKPKLKWS